MVDDPLLLLVRLTARASAVLFSAALLIPGRRRPLWVAFVVAHTVHFGVVARYAATRAGAALFPGDRTLDEGGGWLAMGGIATLFYALAAIGTAPGRAGVAGRTALGLMFLATYGPMLGRSPTYVALAALVAVAVAVGLVRR